MPVAEREEIRFTEFPEMIDDYFSNNVVKVDVIPPALIQDVDSRCTDFEIVTATRYKKYLEQEIEFWEINDPLNKFKIFADVASYKRAKTYLENAIGYANNNPPNEYYCKNELSKSINEISGKLVYSKTTIAKYLVEKCSECSEKYIEGLKCGLSSNRTQNISMSVDMVEGMGAAFVFLKSFSQIPKYCKEDFAKLKENIDEANKAYMELDSRYTNSFRAHEEMVASLKEKEENHIADMKQNSDEFFAESLKKLNDLEELYKEKLKLQAPADYWKKLENAYLIKGIVWVVLSVLSAGLTLFVSIMLLRELPNLFTENPQWIEVFKNSAIFTVALSICIYILRLFVKLATSSFHLSRDAKERNNLSYFYLALKNDGSVSDKERIIVLNSLFSRADTGLLKGDSSPTMPTSANDVIKNLMN